MGDILNTDDRTKSLHDYLYDLCFMFKHILIIIQLHIVVANVLMEIVMAHCTIFYCTLNYTLHSSMLFCCKLESVIIVTVVDEILSKPLLSRFHRG